MWLSPIGGSVLPVIAENCLALPISVPGRLENRGRLPNSVLKFTSHLQTPICQTVHLPTDCTSLSCNGFDMVDAETQAGDSYVVFFLVSSASGDGKPHWRNSRRCTLKTTFCCMEPTHYGRSWTVSDTLIGHTLRFRAILLHSVCPINSIQFILKECHHPKAQIQKSVVPSFISMCCPGPLKVAGHCRLGPRLQSPFLTQPIIEIAKASKANR